MLKKIVVATATLVASSGIAFANALPYVGADVGLNTGTVKLKDTANNTTNFSNRGASAGLFAGMGGEVAQNVYLGAEVFGNESSAHTSTKQISTNQGTANAKIKMRYSYGASIIPGYKFTEDTMAFARVGVIRSRYELNQSVVPAGSTSNTSRNTATGAQFGVGAQTNLTKDWAVRGEYDYSTYRSFTAYGNKISPRDNAVKVGLIYKFD